MATTKKPFLPHELPFRSEIAQSFGGEHALGAVSAFSGPGVQDVASELSAAAFTSGNVVAFAQDPTLHDAAHEAAHVLQQRSGMFLFDGYADHEDHADAVADRVVSGASASDLLPQGGTPTAAVQCKKSSSDGKKKETPAKDETPAKKESPSKEHVEILRQQMQQARASEEQAKELFNYAAVLKESGAAQKDIDEAMNAATELHAMASSTRQDLLRQTASAYGIDLKGIDLLTFSTKLDSGTAATAYAKGELKDDKVVVRIGEDAFNSPDPDNPDSPAYLASVLGHEAFHVQKQMTKEGKWRDSKKAYGDELNELQAYDDELEKAAHYGLTEKEQEKIQRDRQKQYEKLPKTYKENVDDGFYFAPVTSN